jgi:hypothetical protein
MGDWVDEFGPYYEIPGFLPFLVRKGVLGDLSWHNDVSPSFGLVNSDPNEEVRLWVEHPFKDQRETGPDDNRFLVDVMIDDERRFEHHTDDLQEALETLFVQMSKFHSHSLRRHTFDWMPDENASGPWGDPIGYLNSLKKEYFEDPRA